MLQDFTEKSGKKETAARVSRLRGQMKTHKLNGFLVPRGDAWQGEYVAPVDERLAWISGFTGSAGWALITRDEAILFTDGRYTVQARRQIDKALFTLKEVPQNTLADWLKEQRKGWRLGYDPWLHTAAEIARWPRHIKPVAVKNLVDAIWRGKPKRVLAPARAHKLVYCGERHAVKREKIATKLRASGQALCLLTRPDSISWLLNIRGRDVPHTPYVLSFAVLHADASVDLFIEKEKCPPALLTHLGNAVRVQPPSALPAFLARVKKRIGYDPAHTPALLAQKLAKSHAQPAADPCQLPKAIKNAAEIKGARAAHLIDGVALTRFLYWLSRQPAGTVDEIMAVRHLEHCRAQNPALQDISFDTIAGSGAHGAIVHYRVSEASNRLMCGGDLLLVDSGGQYFTGTTDVTRTIAIGKPSAEQRRAFTLVLKGHIAIAGLVFPPGAVGAQLDGLARQFLWRAGLDYAHGTGHGVGSYLSVHEGPQGISSRSGAALHAGMILSNEPGYYKEGSYGIRIENLILVLPAARRGGGMMHAFEVLTLAPIDLSLVDVALLTAEERAWLNSYHLRVYGCVSPHLSPPEAQWLKKQTRGI